MARESRFERDIIERIYETYPGIVVLKNDPSFQQGIPDRLFLNGPYWAALEFKRSSDASVRPNQVYWVNRLNTMSYANFIFPENMSEVLNELQRSLRGQR
jgi:hypothetical protein